MANVLALLEAMEAEAAREAEAAAAYRDRVAGALRTLDGLAAGPPPRLARGRRNRHGHALDAARREVRRALDALGPAPPPARG